MFNTIRDTTFVQLGELFKIVTSLFFQCLLLFLELNPTVPKSVSHRNPENQLGLAEPIVRSVVQVCDMSA